MTELLIADDELAIRKAYKALFESEGFAVRTARNGKEAVAAFLEKRPDAVLMDMMMPVMNGIAACSEIRKADALVPVLFFTAAPGEVAMVRAFGCGADDYIDKTKSPEEFIARVKAAVRRSAARDSALAEEDVLRIGAVEIDFKAISAAGPEGEIPLSRSEALFLRLLSSPRGCTRTFDEIFGALRGEGYVGDVRALRTLVSRLKAKLGPAGEAISSERGTGYMMVR